MAEFAMKNVNLNTCEDIGKLIRELRRQQDITLECVIGTPAQNAKI